MYLLDSTINLNNWDLGVYNIFWSKIKDGQDLENQVAHPHQELPGVPPLGGGADNTP